MLSVKNEMEILFDGVAENEGFARVAVAAFVTHLNPTLEELDDIKTAVSRSSMDMEIWRDTEEKESRSSSHSLFIRER